MSKEPENLKCFEQEEAKWKSEVKAEAVRIRNNKPSNMSDRFDERFSGMMDIGHGRQKYWNFNEKDLKSFIEEEKVRWKEEMRERIKNLPMQGVLANHLVLVEKSAVLKLLE